MSLAQGNNTPTRPRIEPGSPDPESDALTTRPVRPQQNNGRFSMDLVIAYKVFFLIDSARIDIVFQDSG